jgi:arylformamidase
MARMARSVTQAALALAAVALAALAAPAAAPAIVATTDISYDRGSPPPDPRHNLLDVYAPDDAEPGDERPVVVYVHGGGWAIGDKRNRIADKASLFTGAGYVFASVNYRLSPEDNTFDPARIRFPDHPDDVGEAIGWIDRNIDGFGGDPTRLLLIGHSAGAHLVSLVSTDPRYTRRHGVEPWQLVGTTALDTEAFDIAERIDQLPPAGDDIFFNAFGTPEENAAEDSWRRDSPLVFADPGDPRHLFVTQASDASRIANNVAMAAALGQGPGAVVTVPYDHEGINVALGNANDPAAETVAVMDFTRSMVAESAHPNAMLAKRPAKRVRTDDKRAKVKFRFASSQARSRFECRLDSTRLRPCDRRETLHARAGGHVLRLRAVSERGRPGPTEKFRFRVVTDA